MATSSWTAVLQDGSAVAQADCRDMQPKEAGCCWVGKEEGEGGRDAAEHKRARGKRISTSRGRQARGRGRLEPGAKAL